MKHLFKVSLQHSDLFVSAVSTDKNTITWQIYDKTGKPMEPEKTEKYVVHNNEMIFDKNRSLPLALAETINQTLNG